MFFLRKGLIIGFTDVIMLASTNLLLKTTSRSLLASHARRQALHSTAVKSLSEVDVEVEHGRGQWKTYGDVENYKPGRYQIKTFNKISSVGLARFPSDVYDVCTGEEAANAHAVLLRSHKLQEDEIPHTVRAIARYVTFCRCLGGHKSDPPWS